MTTASAAWDQKFVEVAGYRIETLTAGEGAPLVVLPDDIGTPGWLPFHEALARRRRLVLVSHPGFGQSERPDWARNVRDLAALERGLLRQLRLDGADVLGLGLGGWLAMELATFCPGQFRRIALAAPFGLKPDEGAIYDQFLGRGPAYARAGFATAGAFEATYGDEPPIETLEGWEINREMTARVAWAPYLFSQALPHLLPLVDSPVLIAWGDHDAIIPSSTASLWAKLLPRVSVRLMPGAGHRLDVERPLGLAEAVLSFLEDNDA